MINSLQNNLKVKFDNESYLIQAITHSSYAKERHKADYNEKLEFLGDSVLQFAVTEHLYKNYRDKNEGELTKIRALIVCEPSLFKVATKWKLGEYILLSKGEELTGGRERISILADAVEAVIAAVFLDKGMEFAVKFVIDNLLEIIEKATKNEIILDYKTKLQEILQKKGNVSIIYNLDKEEGPDHKKVFYMSLTIDGEIKGSGHGNTKKEAEQKAARLVLVRMGVINE